jgi:hypothetical protein
MQIFDKGSIWLSDLDLHDGWAIFYVTKNDDSLIEALLISASNDCHFERYADIKGGPASLGSLFLFYDESFVACNAKRII